MGILLELDKQLDADESETNYTFKKLKICYGRLLIFWVFDIFTVVRGHLSSIFFSNFYLKIFHHKFQKIQLFQ